MGRKIRGRGIGTRKLGHGSWKPQVEHLDEFLEHNKKMARDAKARMKRNR